VITAGVDLAAEANGTAVALIAWGDSSARLTTLDEGADDAGVLAGAREADKVGVDCPFGWPTAFVHLVHDHELGQLEAPPSSGRDWRRGLTMRVTDQYVHRVTGLTPLSVAADRIGHAALRWAAIAATLAGNGLDVSRDGSGLLAEVYPAAALHHWRWPHRGYKGPSNRPVRESLVDRLLAEAPWLDLGEHEQACRRSDDALDAVLCALVARAVALHATGAPGPDHPIATVEGWIHVPTVPLEVLIRSP
jgi:predicted nuclease with RNAse H fold